MNYAFQVKKLTTLITFYTTNSSFHVKQLLENPTSEFKQSAYKLFHEIFKHSVPVDSQQISPVDAIFDSVTASLDLINQSEVALIEATQKWWNEWYFVLTMEHSLSHEKEDVPYSFLSKKMHHPMKRHEMSHYAHLFTILPMPISNVCAKTGDIIRVNQRFIDVFGYTVDDLPNLEQWWVNAYPDPHYRESVKKTWQSALEIGNETGQDIPANDYHVTCKNGNTITMEVSGINLGEEYIAVFNDATKRLEDQNILRDMAFLDSLTQIANRRRFDEKLSKEFEKAVECGDDLAIILIDIDHFKLFNDRYGHVEGDLCLYNVAQAIACTVSRTEDFVARYGGEEFVVLLPQTDKQGALFIAEHIQKAIEELHIPHEDSFTGYLTLSMGIHAINKEDSCDQKEFIKAADSALYYSKRQGRNCLALS
ncbi:MULTISPECIES: sensor domain-containing diguanylate cyclase [unclassified Pseudoalteromonas]|uniref:sensor domain-containing diguanylate cyclase n=1 Tax=unclassified Pseudoalteromonas TaxID=194690 RepID=UPI002358F565|nr:MULTISPECIES: diguanylate cyclase [unclassified Pseudoalteromonas]MDC9563135.1 diguanylate cyclase [Pseudoalteromonas sp. GAB2316C]MDC9567505.1 diguanylate cyclase [Pseudoalteromonas sp. GABNB9D]MDC9571797.1 diguanylate cyclase [Pseudoalteromonas sp. GABNS16A]MDC9576185.1 diguanylate cyclase [Pseudoalteromonas sp. GABNS16E]MDC9583582.1 diguanylate cyclase [Pseudoalteromonas sp. GABNS16C]